MGVEVDAGEVEGSGKGVVGGCGMGAEGSVRVVGANVDAIVAGAILYPSEVLCKR